MGIGSGAMERIRRFFRDPLNVVALAAGMVWSATAVGGRPIGDYGVETDFYGDVVPKAREWVIGHPVPSGFRGPFYYITIGFLGTALQDFFLAAKLLSVVSAAVGLRLAGALLRRLWDPMVGVCGALFLAANVHVVWFSIRACTDMVFWLLFVATLYLLLADERRTARRWAGAGVLAGLAWLTRYNGLALLPSAVLVAAFTQRPVRRGARNLLAFAGTWALVAAPWALYLWRVKGDPLWNTNFQNVATEVFAQDPNTAVQGKLWSFVGFESMREVWAVAPSRLVHTMTGNIVGHLRLDVRELVGPVWAAAAVIGVYAGRHGWREPRRLAFAACGVMTYLALLPVFYNPRFMIPLLLWWGAGVGGLGAAAAAWWQARAREKPVNRRRRRLPAGAVIALLAGLAIITSANEIKDSVNPGHASKGPPLELVGLARLVLDAGVPVGPTTPIAARKPQIGYLLDAPVVPIPFGSLDDLRASGAHYLLVSGAEANQFVGLRYLVWLPDPEKAPKGLRLVARNAVPVGENARVASLYAIADPAPWAPDPPEPRPREDRLVPGLSRLETLRLKLARWYLLWEPFQPMTRILDRMSPSARRHPEVLQLRGDIAMQSKDLEAAEAWYGKALKEDPASAAAILRIASVRYLQDRPTEFDAHIRRYGEATGMDTASLQAWWDLGMEFGKEGQYAPALAPFAIAATVQPDVASFLENLGVALESMGWEDRARAAYTTFLEQHPGDPKIMEALDSLERRVERLKERGRQAAVRR